MEPTTYPAKLPTRTALRKTASRIRAATLGHAPSAAALLTVSVATAARAAIATVAAIAGVAIAVAMASLSAHPVVLLTIAFVTTFALYTLPLLALRAVARPAQAIRATA